MSARECLKTPDCGRRLSHDLVVDGSPAKSGQMNIAGAGAGAGGIACRLAQIARSILAAPVTASCLP